MKYLLDTNICIYIMKQRPESVLQRFRVMNQNDLGLSIALGCRVEIRRCEKSESTP